MPEIMIKI